jgi:hypothetical protein
MSLEAVLRLFGQSEQLIGVGRDDPYHADAALPLRCVVLWQDAGRAADPRHIA